LSLEEFEFHQCMDETNDIAEMMSDGDTVVNELQTIPRDVKEVSTGTNASQSSGKDDQEKIVDAQEAFPGSSILTALMPNIHPVLQAAGAVEVDSEYIVTGTFGEVISSNEVIAQALLQAKAQRHGDFESNSTCVPSQTSTDMLKQNVGSLGHPELCKRPCLYFSKGACMNGTSCTFCHLPHPRRTPHLDKMNRQFMQAMPFEEYTSLILLVIREKVHLGMISMLLPSLQSLATHLGCVDFPTETHLHGRRRRMQKLHDCLRAFSVGCLLGMLDRKVTTAVQHQSIANFKQGLENLIHSQPTHFLEETYE